ncbi:MAG TPA: TRAP transporter small permease subunit [Noviherbaspirillum sp.]|jgi:TRAP-type C4-dicarboxylate transport system permease small subunit|uniref:TRAP transporter small permease n=1 Tax=Noviherbaspirillum sp. TaxID=1926288 RepID=UPI002DDD5060|nr:TRAP transporter small permease subunit [Noviherbaspirillum sp.]HEV2610033.1 TRAP transporter small permease subunit [Noviherbaspirillum sp.]
MKRLLSATETIAAVFLLLIALLTSGNVILRDLFGQTVPDWFDGSRLLLGIAMFWGISIATYRAGHICVDAVWEMMNTTNRRRIDVLASLLTLAFLAPLAWMIWVKVGNTGTQATSDLRLPMIWFYAVAAAGAVVAALLAALRAFEVARGHDPHDDLDDVGEARHGS